METRLSKKIATEKVNKTADFRKWLNEVKRYDDQLHNEREEYERIAKESREAGRRNNSATEPNRRVPNPNTNAASSASTSTSNAPHKQCPALLSSERQLLRDNDGCLKCRRFFVDHRASNCPNNFPSPVNYRTLTQTDVDRAKRNRTKPIAAVSSTSTLPTPAPADTPSDTSMSSQYHHVAAVMGMSTNPTAYVAANTSNVIGDANSSGSSEDSSFPGVSTLPTVASVSSPHTTQPLHVPHMYWRCLTSGKSHEFPVSFEALIDHGSSLVLISNSCANDLGLRRKRLKKPFSAELAMQTNGQRSQIHFSEYVKLQLHDPSALWTSKSIRAVIAPNLCAPMILGLPFLSHNDIVVDAASRTAVDKKSGFDLLNPVAPIVPPPKKKLKDFFIELKQDRKLMVAELKMVCAERKNFLKHKFEIVKPVDIIAAVRERVEILAAQDQLTQLGKDILGEFKDVFAPIPHHDDLPHDFYCRIKLKDASKTVSTRTYTTPRKYREAWATLIQQHLDAGRIRPSNSAHASPAFIVPKSDAAVLPRWVNDYRILNANTVLDAHPLPRVDDILADCAKGKIWSKLDMTNLFFQT